jgi:hypothetical protein
MPHTAAFRRMGPLGRTQRVLQLAAMRYLMLMETVQIEAAEIASVLCAVAWFLPVALQPGFMHTSVYLRSLERYLPAPALVTITGFLIVYQVVSLTLGGVPPLVPGTGHLQKRWYRVREAGLWRLRLLYATAVAEHEYRHLREQTDCIAERRGTDGTIEASATTQEINTVEAAVRERYPAA